MAKHGFYLRMALQNLGKNRLFYLPFGLTGAMCAAMCYIMRYLSYNELIDTMPGSAYVKSMLALGSAILVFLVVWIMAYANGFVMRRRKRELALYNILGMGKGHIARILGLETLFLAIGCILVGVLGGALLSKLVLLLLIRLMQLSVPLGFGFSVRGALETAGLFLALFFALYLYNLVGVQMASPIELLHSNATGEKEPKTRVFMAVLGVLALGGGYAIAITTKNGLAAIILFFVAVGLVILGTHCLFGAGSVVLLKALRKNKAFYYKPGNFTAVSGLIYRMNQNARGLANICILATTVLVSVATTVGLYAGCQDSLARNFPHEVSLATTVEDDRIVGAEAALAAYDEAVYAAAAQYGCPRDAMHSYTYLPLVAKQGADGSFSGYSPAQGGMSKEVCSVNVLDAADYEQLTGEQVELAQGEALAQADFELGGAFVMGDQRFAVVGTPGAIPRLEAQYGDYGRELFLVVPDRAALVALRGAAVVGCGKISYNTVFDPGTLDDDTIIAMGAAVLNAANTAAADPVFGGAGVDNWVRAEMKAEYYNLYGSFMFLGLFLALMFTTATVLIIYYKQLSEGYEDRDRFLIMQEVGMSAGEVRGTIRRQVLLVFFLPLVMAGIHVAAAFPILWTMLSLFGLSNVGLFVACTAATLALFAVCYILVYALTARRYYKIVRM